MKDKHIVVKKLKSGIKVSTKSKLYFEDYFVILFMIFIGFFIHDAIYDKLSWLFIAFNGIVGLLLVVPSKYNAEKKTYQSLYLLSISSTCLYKPLVNLSMLHKKNKLLKEIKDENL